MKTHSCEGNYGRRAERKRISLLVVMMLSGVCVAFGAQNGKKGLVIGFAGFFTGNSWNDQLLYDNREKRPHKTQSLLV